MRRILTVCFITSFVLLNAQNKNQEQSIELPDFVITGVQSFELPTIQKRKAELIPLLSKQYFNPHYEPEELILSRIEVPFNDTPELFTQDNIFNGELIIGAGRYSLPVGNLFISTDFSGTLLRARLWGQNTTAYKNFSNYNETGIELGSTIFIDNSSSFLPGLKVNMDASYLGNSYNYFASAIPSSERIGKLGKGNILFDFNTDRLVNFMLSIGGNSLSVSDDNIKETKINGKGLLKVIMPQFSIYAEGSYLNTDYTDDILGNNASSFYSVKSGIDFEFSRNLILSGGVYYSNANSKTFFSPFASAIIKVNNFVSLSGEVGGESSYRAFADLLTINRYIKGSVNTDVYIEDAMNIKFSIRYQFDKYFELTGGAGYSKYNNYFYFDDSASPGVFDITPASDLNRIYFFGKAYFHLGPFGTFYGNVDFQQFTFNDDNYLPYEPVLKSMLEYRYKTGYGLGFGIKYSMTAGNYIDRFNVNKIDDYHNIGLAFSYILFRNFNVTLDLQNILNKDICKWNGYYEKPIDIILGLKYVW